MDATVNVIRRCALQRSISNSDFVTCNQACLEGRRRRTVFLGSRDVCSLCRRSRI